MNKYLPRQVLAALLFVGLIVLDQNTKNWAEHQLQPRGSMSIVPGFFNLTYVRNTGMAFGLFGGNNRLLMAVALLILIGAITVAGRFDFRRWETLLLASLLAAGSLGNLTDRFLHGYVIDFLDFNLIVYRWPCFNIADSCISIGLLWILYRTLTTRPRVMHHE